MGRVKECRCVNFLILSQQALLFLTSYIELELELELRCDVYRGIMIYVLRIMMNTLVTLAQYHVNVSFFSVLQGFSFIGE